MAINSNDSQFDSALISAAPDDALRVLAQVGDRAAQLIEVWVAQSNAGAVAMAAEQGSGSVRKVARRGLNILKSRGVTIPTRGRVATVAQIHSVPTIRAWIMPPDASGGVVMILAAHTPTRRCRTAFVYMHDELGIHRVESGEQSVTQLKEAMARLAPGTSLKPIEVPLDWARARIDRARKRHAASGIPQPLGLTSIARLLDPTPADHPEHPFDSEGFELSDEDAREFAAGSARLHELPEFRNWLPPRVALDEMLSKIGEHLTPDVQPEQSELTLIIEKEVKSATDRLFSPQSREQLVTTMKDSALSVLSREGEAKTLEVVATMKRILAAGLITDPPHEVGFLRAFFDKALAVLLAQGQGRLSIPVRRAANLPETNAETSADSNADPAPAPANAASPTDATLEAVPASAPTETEPAGTPLESTPTQASSENATNESALSST